MKNTKEYMAEWRANNKDRIKGYTKAYNTKHREAKNARIRERMTQRSINGICKHCNTPRLPHSKNFCEKHYFACVAARLGDGSVEMAEALRKKWHDQKGICPYTNQQMLLGLDSSLDHILPVSKYPELKMDINNLEWITTSLNKAKGNMTKEEFMVMLKQLLIHIFNNG